MYVCPIAATMEPTLNCVLERPPGFPASKAPGSLAIFKTNAFKKLIMMAKIAKGKTVQNC